MKKIKISRRQFNRMAKEHYGLSKKATREAWKALHFRRGTDLYGCGDAARGLFCDLVNFAAENWDW